MAQGISGGSTQTEERVEKLTPHIVVDSVKIRERELIVDVPLVVFEEVKYEKPIITEKKVEVIKYITKEKDTIKYIPKEKETVVYKPVNVEFEKPIIKKVECEKPVLKEKIYEKPVIIEKEIEVVTTKDIGLVKELIKEVKDLSSRIVEIKKELDMLRHYRLIEQEVIVPKLQWTVVKVERIEWVDVKRERPNANTNT